MNKNKKENKDECTQVAIFGKGFCFGISSPILSVYALMSDVHST